uniref:Uncharacterized protein n=1 Tax=Plectus sambesii TaxID=2011161 RepID=A0A914WZK3_9BILA
TPSATLSVGAFATLASGQCARRFCKGEYRLASDPPARRPPASKNTATGLN